MKEHCNEKTARDVEGFKIIVLIFRQMTLTRLRASLAALLASVHVIHVHVYVPTYLRSGDAKPELRLRCIAATLPRKYFITSLQLYKSFPSWPLRR